MHVVYRGSGGAHAAALAAAVHLGRLDPARPPAVEDLLAHMIGIGGGARDAPPRLWRVGRDAAGHAVYVWRHGPAGPVVERGLRALLAAAGLPAGEFVFVDMDAVVNPWLRLGGLLRRAAGDAALVGLLLGRGLRDALPAVTALVERTRASLGEHPEPGTQHPPGGMRVVYYCYGGVHTSVVAAAIHTRALPRRTRPPVAAIRALPLFDRTGGRAWGSVEWVGRDARGVEVGVMGLGPGRRLAARSILQAVRALGADPGRVLLVPVLERTGVLVRIGGFLAQRLGWHEVGGTLVAWGLQRAYPRLVDLVARVERRAARGVAAGRRIDAPEPARR